MICYAASDEMKDMGYFVTLLIRRQKLRGLPLFFFVSRLYYDHIVQYPINW